MTERHLIGAAAAVVLLAGSGVLLAPAGRAIDAARTRAESDAWRAVIATAVADLAYDNDPLAQGREVANPVLFGTDEVASYWPLTRAGDGVATVIRVPVPEAYNGRLDVVVGIGRDGGVRGVAVPRHRETPAYGGRLVNDPVFLERFRGRTQFTPAPAWEVAPGDGAIDGVTGATITMTAVTNGVLRALRQHAVLNAGTAE